MWAKTRITDLLGMRYPIIQGPFGGGLSSVALVAAVAEAGGVGSFGANGLAPSSIQQTVAQLRALTTGPFNINLWVPLPGERELAFTPESFADAVARIRPYFDELGLAPPAYSAAVGQRFEEQVAAALEARPPILSFVFGVPPASVLAACRERQIVTLGTATTVAEARALDAAGVDAIVASGSDAGGHRCSFLQPAERSLVGTFSLIPQVVDAVKAPVIAAGGIADGRGVAAALRLGASAVQIGSAFLACDESGASESHKAAIAEAGAEVTVLTRAFSGRWARGIENRFMREQAGAEVAPYPLQNWLTTPLRRAAAAASRGDLQALWCGQAGPLVRRQGAKQLLERLVSEAESTSRTI